MSFRQMRDVCVAVFIKNKTAFLYFLKDKGTSEHFDPQRL